MAKYPTILANEAFGINTTGFEQADTNAIALPKGPCDPEKFFENIMKSINKVKKDIVKIFDGLAFKIGGNFLATVAILVAALIGTTAVAVLDIIATGIINSVVGAVMSVLVAALAAINGAELVFQYYLVVQLRNKLQQRITLLGILLNEIDNIIQFFNWYVNLLKKIKNDDFNKSEFRLAIKYITAAKNILIAEDNRISIDDKQIRVASKPAISSAQRNVLDAANALTNKYFLNTNTSSNLTAIEEKYNLNTKHPKHKNIFNTQLELWISYFIDLQKELHDRFLTDEAGDLTNEAAVRKQNNIRRLMNILSEIIPELPIILREFVLQQMFSSSASILLEKIPVWTNIINDIDKTIENLSDKAGLKNGLFSKVMNTEKATGVELSINDLLAQRNLNPVSMNGINLKTISDASKNPFFTDKETKYLTTRTISDNIKIIEAGILMFPTNWDNLIFFGSMQLTIIRDVIKELEENTEEIQEMLDTSTNSTISNTTTLFNKTSISVKLISEANKLKTILHDKSGYNLIELEQIATKILNQLKKQIIENTWDKNENKARTIPVDRAFTIAQKNLGMLNLNALLLSKPKTITAIINNLQAIKILWQKQINTDSIELSLCNDYIKTLESSSTFMETKAKVDNLLNTLGQNKIFGQTASNLLQGAVKGTLDIMQGVRELDAAVKSMDCIKDLVDTSDIPYLDSLTNAMKLNPYNLAPDMQKIQSIQREVKEAISSVSETVDILKMKVNTTKNNIKKKAELLTKPAPKIEPFNLSTSISKIGSIY